MHAMILRYRILLAIATLGASAATAQTELYFATGVDSTGWAQAQSNVDGHVLIESPQYPRGLWLHLVDEAGDALTGLQVEYQGRPDSLVAIHCVDPTGNVQETLVWTRPEGELLRLTLKPQEAIDLPAGLVPIDWQVDPNAASLLEPVAESRLIGWDTVAAFLQKRWPGQAGRVAVQIKSGITATNLAVERSRPDAIRMLVAHLQQVHQPAGISLEETTDIEIEVRVFKGNLALLEGVIYLNPFFFADVALATAVRQVLEAQGRTPGSPITWQEAASLTELWANDKAIHSLVGIEHLTALQSLALHDNQVVDIAPLKQLTDLTWIELRHNQIADITPLNQLTNLNMLSLSGNQIVDITPLNQLTNLEILELHDNQIVDVATLNQLTNLERLSLSSNQIADITPLNQLTNLNVLSLSGNQIADITPLNQLTNLNVLFLSSSQVDITPLNQLTNLTWLELRHNQIVDITLLNQLTNLETLWLSSNQISDIAPLKQLTKLKSLSLAGNQIIDITLLQQLANLRLLELYGNQIVDITPLNQLTNLETLGLSNNQIVDITPLNQLTNLQSIALDNNQITDVSPLVANPGLGVGDDVWLRNNPLSTQARNEQIPALKERGVSVTY